jgi:HlyD family secretion protein
MHPEPKRIVPVILVVVVGLITWAFFTQRSAATSRVLTYSGTIEATQIHLASEMGGSVKRVNVKQGGPVQAGQVLVELYSAANTALTSISNEKITAPIDGVVLEVLVEPGEVANPGATLAVVSDLDQLTLTVYVPEDRYGVIMLGQDYPVTVDSFPDETFSGRVAYISDQAEFTPRNVQTTDSRKATVFAIKLDLDPSGGRLKPGMPADVNFQGGQ